MLLCIDAALAKDACIDDVFNEHVAHAHVRVMDDMAAKGVDVSKARSAIDALLKECRGMLHGVALLRVRSAHTQ